MPPAKYRFNVRHLPTRILLVLLLCIATSACEPPEEDYLDIINAKIAALPAPKAPFFDGLIYKETWLREVALDLYLPYNHEQINASKHPVYIYIHGGAWMQGDRKIVRLAERRIEVLRTNGVAILSIDYRKFQQAGIGGAVDDARDSLRWLVDNAEQYHFDISKVVIHGQSSGAHLALMAGFGETDPSLVIQMILDDFGPTDLVDLQYQQKDNGPNLLQLYTNNHLRKLSPITYVRSGLPPVFIVHARGDDLVPLAQSENLRDVLIAKNNLAQLEVLEIFGADHGFENTSDEFNAKLDRRRTQLIMDALK